MFVRFALNSFIELDSLTCDGRAFQSSTTLFEKKFFLISVLHLFFLRFSGCDEERVCIPLLFCAIIYDNNSFYPRFLSYQKYLHMPTLAKITLRRYYVNSSQNYTT